MPKENKNPNQKPKCLLSISKDSLYAYISDSSGKLLQTLDMIKILASKEKDLWNQISDPRYRDGLLKLGEILKLEYGKPLGDLKRKFDGKYVVYGEIRVIRLSRVEGR